MWKCENEEDHNAIEPLELALFSSGREKKFFHLKNPISLSSERIIIIFYIIPIHPISTFTTFFSISTLFLSLQRCRTAYDFCKFGSNSGLAGTVIRYF
jgi:hypothetical protein